jgi:hypothetical protein
MPVISQFTHVCNSEKSYKGELVVFSNSMAFFIVPMKIEKTLQRISLERIENYPLPPVIAFVSWGKIAKYINVGASSAYPNSIAFELSF